MMPFKAHEAKLVATPPPEEKAKEKPAERPDQPEKKPSKQEVN